MKQIFALIISFLCIFSIGCFTRAIQETPQQRFEKFIQGVSKKNQNQIINSLTKSSIESLQSSAFPETTGISWLEKLILETSHASPSYLKTSWIKRDEVARVHYQHSGSLEDFLVLVRFQKQWKIQLPLKGHNHELKTYQVITSK